MTSALDVDLLPGEVEEDLRNTVGSVLATQCDPAGLMRMYDGGRGVAEGLWTTLASDVGSAGLLVPESRGGHGGSVREAAGVAEELGRRVAPVPFVTSSVIATARCLPPSLDWFASLHQERGQLP